MFLGLVIASAVALCASTPGEELPRPVDALPEELVAALDIFYSAIETDDVEARVGLLADDVVMMPNHWTMALGKEDVSAIFRSAAGAVFRLRDRTIVQASVSGDLAYTVNSYYYTYHAEGDEPQWHKTKNVHVWRRGEDGAWKLQVDIWNSDVPISAFADE